MMGACDEIILQRCVDGELDVVQRRELLHRLDEAPDRWRELALMFIENQVVGSACGEFVSRAEMARSENGRSRPLAIAVPGPAVKRHRGDGKIAWPLVVVSMLLGVAVTMGTRGLWRQPPPQPVVDHARPSTSSPPGESIDIVATDSSRKATEVPQVKVQDSAAAKDPLRPVMELNLLASDGAQEVSIPVFSKEQMDTVWPGTGSLVPKEFIRQLERSGLQLDREARWMVYPLDDGSSVVIPTESVRVQYAVQ